MSLEEEVPYQDLTYAIIGAAMATHNKLGPGHKEAVYQKMLTEEMVARGLSVEPERAIEIVVDEQVHGLLHLDHLVNQAVVVECKPLSLLLTREEVAQVIASTRNPVCLLTVLAEGLEDEQRGGHTASSLLQAGLAWEKRRLAGC